MRRFFVLFIVFLIPLQFLDESFDDLVLPVAFSDAQAGSLTTEKLPGNYCEKSNLDFDSSASQAPHADLSDSVAIWVLPTPSSLPASLMSRVVEHIFPLRIFPILEPPRT